MDSFMYSRGQKLLSMVLNSQDQKHANLFLPPFETTKGISKTEMNVATKKFNKLEDNLQEMHDSLCASSRNSEELFHKEEMKKNSRNFDDKNDQFDDMLDSLSASSGKSEELFHKEEMKKKSRNFDDKDDQFDDMLDSLSASLGNSEELFHKEEMKNNSRKFDEKHDQFDDMSDSHSDSSGNSEKLIKKEEMKKCSRKLTYTSEFDKNVDQLNEKSDYLSDSSEYSDILSNKGKMKKYTRKLTYTSDLEDSNEDANVSCNAVRVLQEIPYSSSPSKSKTKNYIRVPPSSKRGTHTKIFFCIFCKEKVRRFGRHLISLHKSEKKVANILRYPVKHKERNRLIAEIRNEGTFLYNTSEKFNTGEYIVSRRPNENIPRQAKDYVPCPHCKGYYISKNLHKHNKKCFSNNKIYKYQGTLAQSRALSLEMEIKHLNLHPNVPRLLSDLKNDEISQIIKRDELLLRHASQLCYKYRTEIHLKHHSRQKLRQLARLLFCIKKEFPEIIDLKDCLQPKHFFKIIYGVQKVCEYNADTGEFKIPSMANHLGIYLKECANVLYSKCIIDQDDEMKKNVNDFKDLLCLQYGTSISRSARKTLEESKWNKPKLLPITSDIKKFRDHLINIADTSCLELLNKFSYEIWRKLVEVTAAIVLIFNRKRPGETERILLRNYQQKQTIEETSEDYKTLTTLEKLLCASFKRIEVRGKLGRRVPILLRANHIKYIDTFLQYRKQAGVSSNNVYLFGVDKKRFIHITDVIRRESVVSGATQPNLLRATFLRKQVATTSQVLELNDNEMQMIADFMGHDLNIHKSHYRTPELTMQVARLSKLLIAVDEGDINKCKDKNLKNIDIEKYLDVREDTLVPFLPDNLNTDEISDLYLNRDQNEKDSDAVLNLDTGEKNSHGNMNLYNEENLNAELLTTISPGITPEKKRKVKRTTWSTPEKTIIRKEFQHHLQNMTLPSERHIANIIRNNPELNRRTPAQVKSWLSNQKQKKLRAK